MYKKMRASIYRMFRTSEMAIGRKEEQGRQWCILERPNFATIGNDFRERCVQKKVSGDVWKNVF